ncbi:unnamed protein product [Dibothriocephalus latus]|uniref:Uncharacterized protein n=1 Tax=Dibothriocephalus latus TaxID=60516 RepID=A0A3P6TCN2_DIBLA|nr:unnamed protein product [Dibothriocephalus latus]
MGLVEILRYCTCRGVYTDDCPWLVPAISTLDRWLKAYYEGGTERGKRSVHSERNLHLPAINKCVMNAMLL